MSLEVIEAFPPNHAQIVGRFPAAARVETIFAWGDKIYVPSGEDLSQELMEHESVHGARQLELGIEAWWDRYLTDDQFVFDEELPAHMAEYRAYCENHRYGRGRFLKEIAKRLSGPLYNHPVTLGKAIHLIKYGRPGLAK